jgi:hypothetical protein
VTIDDHRLATMSMDDLYEGMNEINEIFSDLGNRNGARKSGPQPFSFDAKE